MLALLIHHSYVRFQPFLFPEFFLLVLHSSFFIMNLTRLISFFICCLIFSFEVRCAVLQFLQNHVAGSRVNFLNIPWSINPDEGLIRRLEYEAINGRYGYKQVERIGLGEDGRTEERRIQQRLRDAVGALSYQPSSSYYTSVSPH